MKDLSDMKRSDAVSVKKSCHWNDSLTVFEAVEQSEHDVESADLSEEKRDVDNGKEFGTTQWGIFGVASAVVGLLLRSTASTDIVDEDDVVGASGLLQGIGSSRFGESATSAFSATSGTTQGASSMQ